MQTRAIKYLTWSQVVWLATLLVCVGINPAPLWHNYPISYYGTTLWTAVPYAAGLIASGVLLLATRAALRPAVQFKTLRRWLLVLGLLLGGVLLTPYKVNVVMGYIHLFFAGMLFASELSMGVWMVMRNRRDRFGCVLFVAQLCAFAMCCISIKGPIHFMAWAQLAAIAAFSGLLVREIRQIEHSSLHSS